MEWNGTCAVASTRVQGWWDEPCKPTVRLPDWSELVASYSRMESAWGWANGGQPILVCCTRKYVIILGRYSPWRPPTKILGGCVPGIPGGVDASELASCDGQRRCISRSFSTSTNVRSSHVVCMASDQCWAACAPRCQCYDNHAGGGGPYKRSRCQRAPCTVSRQPTVTSRRSGVGSDVSPPPVPEINAKSTRIIVPVSCKFYQWILQWKNFVNRSRFDRITVMSLWPHFFGPPCVAKRHMGRSGGGLQEKGMLLKFSYVYAYCVSSPHILLLHVRLYATLCMQ